MKVQRKYERDAKNGLKRVIGGKQTFGIIVGNRGGKENSLVDDHRKNFLKVIEHSGYECICLTETDSPSGAVGSLNDSKTCARLFQDHAREIDGIIVTLPNFGDERGIANAIRLSGLDVPVLIQAEPDELGKMAFRQRRDSFCGKISVCANLTQFKIPFTLTRTHACAIQSSEFKDELDKFAAICRIVNGVKGARIGAIGARPASFNTVRYSEKILEYHGVSVEPLDLSEIIEMINQYNDADHVAKTVERTRAYMPLDTGNVPEGSLEKIARFLIVLENWIEENDIDAIAFQCWTSFERHIGIVPCGVLSMLSNNMIPAACEVDVPGALTMLVLQLASEAPAVLLDWDNNYGNEPDKCVVFHCSNIARDFLENPTLQNHHSPNFYPDKGFGAVTGKLRANNMTFARLTTNDIEGKVQFYSGRGKFVKDDLQTFGGHGIIQVDDIQQLLRKICLCGFEHHFAATIGNHHDVVVEALERYLGIERPARFQS
ncbi:MAG: L-fucose/L-arabinose isomerase family protein [Candidatus Hodarchaeota archaeon]